MPIGTAALMLAGPVALAALGWTHRWVAEDAFIYLRVVQHLLAGHGPVFNVGERVEVYTSPLWLGLLAAGATLLRPVALEWIAVGLGLLLSAGGLLLAVRGAVLVARAAGRTGLAFPLGGLVVVALPPYWDFATSGLETGLTFGWLGGCFWGLARLHALASDADDPGLRAPRRRETWLAVLIGLGPLIRPDLAIFSAGYLLLVAILSRPERLGGYARVLGAAAALPIAYQIFRMGYFAALVPNPALAKSAFAAHWEQGWRYARDFVEPYWLWVPLGLVLGWWAFDLARHARHGRWRAAALVAAPVALGAVHGAYIVRVGGDFMHARLLLPSLFAMLTPVAAATGLRWWHAALPAATLLPWAAAGALWLGPPYKGGLGAHGIGDERGYYASRSRSPHPVVLPDYALHRFAGEGHRLRELAWHRRAVLLGRDPRALTDPRWQASPAGEVRANVVVARISIGIRGYAAGPRVHVVDRHGLADPLAARFRLGERGRPGHEKYLSDAWLAARFVEPSAPVRPEFVQAPVLAAARAALGCPQLRELLRAVEGRLTPGRFLRNVALAWRFHRLSFSPDPAQAAAELCGSARG